MQIPSMRRGLIRLELALVACASALAPSFAPANRDAQPAEFPRTFAFNRGVFSQRELDEAIQRGDAELVERSASRVVVRHLWLEAIEASKVSTRSAHTLFAVCESTFHEHLPGGLLLVRLELRHVVLDFEGKAVGDTCIGSYRSSLGAWTREIASSGKPSEFARGLSPWARAKLHLATGFLHENPGAPVVAYQRTTRDALLGLIALGIDLAPGVMKHALGAAIETTLKKLSLERLEAALSDEELRWGGAAAFGDARIAQHAAAYAAIGAAVWR